MYWKSWYNNTLLFYYAHKFYNRPKFWVELPLKDARRNRAESSSAIHLLAVYILYISGFIGCVHSNGIICNNPWVKNNVWGWVVNWRLTRTKLYCPSGEEEIRSQNQGHHSFPVKSIFFSNSVLWYSCDPPLALPLVKRNMCREKSRNM